MAEQKAENKIPKNIKRTRKRVRFAAIVIVIAAIICCLLWKAGLWEFQTVDEQLAAIEAARAIPDEENAATIYNQLLEDYDESSLSPDFFDDETEHLTRNEPWLSKDYPKVAEWLQQHKNTISTLMEASKKEKCRFAIIIDVQQMPIRMERLSAMRQWAFLLSRAANNDIAEDRIKAVIQKYHCLIQMANHLYQQPAAIDLLIGMVVEALALNRIKPVILQGDATEAHLKTIETIPLPIKDDWDSHMEQIRPVENLATQKLKEQFGILDHLKYSLNYGIYGMAKPSDFDGIHKIHLRHVASRRGGRILIALRRYKDKNSHWPESLNQIKSSLPQEILTDPHNNGPFVYKLTDNTFRLYSKGKNNVDEDGRYRDPQDDWPIWPPRGRKPKAKKENANDE